MENAAGPGPASPGPGRGTRERRPATEHEIKAVAHPLRLRILRLCGLRELTNKQLADRLGRDPGTVLYHVRRLIDAGLLEAGPVRQGAKGALERPYRATGLSWWLDGALAGAEPDRPRASIDAIEAFQEELREAGPGSVQTVTRFALHLSPEDVAELDRRICALLDEYVTTEDQRHDQPVHGGMVIVHRLAD